VLQNLASFYRDLLIAKAAPKRSDLVALTDATWGKLCNFALKWETELILAGQKHLQTHEVQIKNTTQPRLWLEVTLLGLLPSAITSQQKPTSEPGKIVAPPPQINPIQPRAGTGAPPLQSGGSQTANIEQSSVPNSQNPPQSSQPIANRTENTSPPQNPAPIPTAETNYSDNSTNITADEIDLNQVWEQVLARVRPNGTQSLLRQHGHLVSFSNDAAYVRISSQPLLNMVKDKVSNIQEAFQQVFNRQVTVKLGLTSSTETNSYRANNLPNSNGRVGEDRRNSNQVGDGSQQVHNSPSSENPDDFFRDDRDQQKRRSEAENTPVNVPPVSEMSSRQTNGAIAPQNDSKIEAVGIRAEAQDVANAARELANFLDGEVVELSNDLEVWESESFSWESEPDFPELSSESDLDDFIDW
jgi:DNA polymerase-3 subunit gamma/tau